MAIYRKAWRVVHFEPRPYYWKSRLNRAAPRNRMLEITVVSGEAFKPGRTGQELRFALPQGSRVTAGLIRFVIEHSPHFNGGSGQPHVKPIPSVHAQALALAHACADVE